MSGYNPYQPSPLSPQPRPFDPRQKPPVAQALGWAALGTAALGAIGVVLSFAFIIYMTVEGGAEDLDEESPEAIILGLAILSSMGICFLAIVLSIVGLIAPNQNKLTSGIGLALSLLPLLCTCGVMGLGIFVG
jgi:hypothetical protein